MAVIYDEAGAQLLDEASRPVYDEAGAVATGSWWQLLSIREDARREFDFYANRPPMACPHCGEPLINAPTADSGSGAELFCRFDGWQYPRDWIRPMAY